MNLSLLEGMINELFDMQVAKATDAVEAIEKYTDNRQKYCCNNYFKLILISTNMREMDGFEISTKIFQIQNNRQNFHSQQ